ncbi:hypothetical protein BJ322DRAFT_1019133 [Thelephora terrestris]|uniref:Uncharacterized protein n=1 Tax=Thelephora terrestris TaxID=56493 RepID=A0A9P6HLC5_9AGAM|nr:hypothetical protein BJ322DRAFT_1019133 [Thelephora terrestris]
MNNRTLVHVGGWDDDPFGSGSGRICDRVLVGWAENRDWQPSVEKLKKPPFSALRTLLAWKGEIVPGNLRLWVVRRWSPRFEALKFWTNDPRCTLKGTARRRGSRTQAPIPLLPPGSIFDDGRVNPFKKTRYITPEVVNEMCENGRVKGPRPVTRERRKKASEYPNHCTEDKRIGHPRSSQRARERSTNETAVTGSEGGPKAQSSIVPGSPVQVTNSTQL